MLPDAPHVESLAAKIRSFVDDVVVPLESVHDNLAPAMAIARDKARAAGIYGPQIARRYGGLEHPV